MSDTFYKPPKGSTGHKAIGCIYSAAKAAHGGNLVQAEAHVKQAHLHVGNHVKELTTQGKHLQAKQFNGTAQGLLIKLDRLMDHQKQYAKKSEVIEKSFGTGVGNPKPMGQPTPINASVSGAKVAINHNPGFNPNSDYKAFHEMAPHDQIRALHAHGEKDMDSHLYPHDKKSGEYQFGQRWKAPQDMIASRKPQANEHFPPINPVTPQISPQHKQGAGVRINAEGHEHNGKLGIVQLPNPNMPGKIPVRIQNKGRFENIHVEPSQVKMSKLATTMKSELREAASNVVTLEKSKKVIALLRSEKKR